ncbi:hypothetical protein RHGRI_007146 [Rhododendron griersonianum]|uniref:PHD-type domain-containing protein n=1 Tax=Rhododendron griersonianum TaxID=479676 RepID=A0AAV6KVU5_9ERIC|nr:hypothetical protein RHGRI_007146 [Rhododendron griersonianum]
MKRELAFVLQTQCDLPAGLSPGRTRASKGRVPSGGSNNDGGSRKKLKAESNGLVAIDADQEKVTASQGSDVLLGVYRRTRRNKGAVIIDQSKCNLDEALSREELRDGSEKPVETVIICETKCNLDKGSSKEELRNGGEKPYVSEGGSEVVPVAVETVVVDGIKCNLDEGSSKQELRDGCEKPCVSEGGAEVAPMAVDESNEVKNVEDDEGVKINDLSSNEVANDVNNEVSNGVLVEAPRRFTRSTMNNAEGSSSENGFFLSAEANVGSVDCATGTKTKILELKMSKKIGLQSRPTTTKELLSTGLLEGYPVVYNGGNKHKAAVLRGTIKDIGILCFCRLCKGSRVVSPGVFEIHACKSYRRAAQYICLENGRNLLEVVKACQDSSLNMLEETIRNLIGSLPEKGPLSCHNCKRSFLATTAEKVELLCPSCVALKNSEPAIAETTDTNARSLSPILPVRRSTRSASVIIPLEDKNQESVIKDRSLNQALSPKSPGTSSMRILSHKKNQGRIKKNSSGSPSVSQPIASASALSSSKTNSQGKTTKKVVKPGSARKANIGASVWISSQHQGQSNITKKSAKAILSPRSSKSASLHLSAVDKSKWKITKKLGLHKLVFEDGGLPDGTEVAYYSRGKVVDINKVFMFINVNEQVSASQFEAHAGWASRKKPYQYIYTSNGVSLHEFAISLLKGRKHYEKDNDDLCIICADGGNLLLCDVCPRAFHIECASLTSIPRGKWYCQYCQNMFQREKFVEFNENALAAGRVSGVDPIEQITKRCIRIVKNPEDAEVIACVLCRGYNFRKSGFGSFTVIVCDQCEKEYHVGCLKKHNMADLQELPKGKWFCCMDCERIFSALQKLLIRGEEKIPDSLLDVMKKKHEEKVPDTPTDFDVRWRVLSGKIASPETRLFLSKAVAIFHDCFDPIVDSATGRDFIPSMVYGRNIRGQDFAGMYCAVLTLNSRVVSAGIFRVFGQEIAELPLVATSSDNQGKGYFQVLFSCIERLLAFLNVKWLVLPAAHEAESIWTQKFGFERMPVEQLSNFRKTCWQMLTFTGTSMLQKMVPPCRIIDQLVVDVAMESS